MSSNVKKKVLVAWYGSFKKNGTIGDYLAVKSLSDYLDEIGVKHDCASYKEFKGLSSKIVDIEKCMAHQYHALVFCCGPVIKNHSKLKKLFEKFHKIQKCGISVSLFPEGHFNYFDPFDFVIARENGEKKYADIAIISETDVTASYTKKDAITVGLVFSDKQKEYGVNSCKHEKAKSILEMLAKDLANQNNNFFSSVYKFIKPKNNILLIENHLHRSRKKPDEIENLYRNCDIILTTRFHGAMIALKNQIPFIALDQIQGGAKVYNLVSGTGYPFVWKIDDVKYEEIRKFALELLSGKHMSLIASVKSKTCKQSEETLSVLGNHLKNLNIY